MSAVTERIALYWAGRGNPDFTTPRSLFTPEDQPLIDAGVFTVAEEELHMIRCPFCGEMEIVEILPKSDGTTEHFLACQEEAEGMMVLEPEQYQIMKFNPDAYARYCGGRPQTKRPTLKARSTPFMKEQREAVLNYLQSCNRPASSVTVRDCTHVWNLPENKSGWDRRAKYTDIRRGYRSAKLLCKGIRYSLEM